MSDKFTKKYLPLEVCSYCGEQILPGEIYLDNGEETIHEDCWVYKNSAPQEGAE